ncbi:MAG TPA: Lrp/AsnC family transcriptional regulator [Caulobacteraceae bacterium]|nr:Lrp/AsnC family transcriptional regulator [Caulobacteraceae bacterium]
MPLDALDRRLLAALQRDNQQTADRIGAEIGLSPTAVLRRTRRLRAEGLIKADTAVLDSRALGFGLTCIVEVSLQRETAEIIETFRRQTLAIPQIQQCYYVTGEADFVLVILSRDMADFENLTNDMFLNNPLVRQFRTSVVLTTLKASLAVPVEV